MQSDAQESKTLRDAIDALDALENDESLEDPEQILAWVTVPRSLSQGAPADLVVSIENGRIDRDLRMSSIEIYDEFLSGFEILSMNPEPRHKDHDWGVLSLEYPVDVPPGETWDLTIRLRAVKKGVFIGDVDIYEGDRFLTRAAQARVE